jgi:hypothetical protein
LARDCSIGPAVTTGEIFRSSAFFSFLQNTTFYQLQPSNWHILMPPSRSSKAEALLRPPFIREVFTNQIAQNPNRISRAAESEPTTTKTQHHPADQHHLIAREQLRAPKVGKSRIACRFLIKVYSAPRGSCRSAGGHPRN